VNTPRISVVVPFYNNARLARARAAADPRFTLLQTPNGGPGRARNLGVERATGEFLAFVDGDDMLPPHAYETLLHTLESSGSDFVSGAVQRIGTGGVHPSALHVVLSGTEEYFEALARCRYVVFNDDMQPEFRKRDGQVYLQTWHGTPLKKIGFDIGKPQFASGTAYLDHLAADVAKWDLLLSQNPFSTPILRRAFRFGGEICEYGYPRNDGLSRGCEGAALLRERLCIPDGKRVVLYAPTWRDNQYYASGRYRFDLRLDLDRAAQALGRDHVLLIRGHHHLANDVRAGFHPDFARNVTAYPDITDLLTITDVLITDYSSVMFDFAVTGRPILFFTYDLASYRDKLRGFYFDFEAEAPGPLLATSDEVLAAVAGAGEIAAGYRDSYQTFAAKYCPLDDGKAGARVCDRLFQG